MFLPLPLLVVNPNVCKFVSSFVFESFLTVSLCCLALLRLIVMHCDCGLAKWWGQQEFGIPQNVLEIVYGQTICWIGTFYSPLLPAICTIKYFFMSRR